MSHNRQKIKTKGHAVQKLDCKTDRHNEISDYRLLSTIGRGGVRNTHTHPFNGPFPGELVPER